MPRFARITIDPAQCGGVPCICSLRTPVATIVGLVAQGRTTEQILADYPDLVEEDVREALALGQLGSPSKSIATNGGIRRIISYVRRD